LLVGRRPSERPPRLFLQAEAAAREAERAAANTERAAGEDEHAALLRDLAMIASVCARRSGRLALGRPVPKDWQDERRLFGAWTRARAAFGALAAHLEDVDRGEEIRELEAMQARASHG
jgi:hypothetical protein